jgi:hypothetical protein
LVDPDRLTVTEIGGFGATSDFSGAHDDGPTSVDEGDGVLFVTDRSAGKIDVVDTHTNAIVDGVSLGAQPDYIRFVTSTREQGITSGRSYRGPILPSVQAFGNFGSDDHGLGAFAAMSAGIFSNRSLDTPAFSSESSVDRSSLHIWLELGIRGVVSF